MTTFLLKIPNIVQNIKIAPPRHRTTTPPPRRPAAPCRKNGTKNHAKKTAQAWSSFAWSFNVVAHGLGRAPAPRRARAAQKKDHGMVLFLVVRYYANACSKSAIKSALSSRPQEMRISPAGIPAASSCSSVICL